MARSKDFAMALMLRDQHLSGRIFSWFEAAIVWSLYKHGRNPSWPCVDTWRKGRKCATCRHYSREDEYCWRSGSGVMVPCHPGFDEGDPHMMAPLTCWEPAGGERR